MHCGVVILSVLAMVGQVKVTPSKVSVGSGRPAVVQVVLESAPTGTVTLDFAGGSHTIVTPSGAVFTPTNWQASRTVVIEVAAESPSVVSDVSIGVAVTSDDPYYSALPVWASTPLVAVLYDPAVPSILVSVLSQQAVTTEDGGTFTFTASLSQAPAADVAVQILVSPQEGTPSPSSLVFTPTSWDTPATVVVSGVDDAVTDGNVPYTVTLTCTGGAFDGAAATIDLINADNEAVAVSLQPDTLATYEAGGTSSTEVSLRSQPLADVRIVVSGVVEREGAIAGKHPLVFTPANYHVAQLLTIRGTDDLTMDGDQWYNLTLTALSTDARWNGVQKQLRVGNIDNDGFRHVRFTPTKVLGVPGGAWRQVALAQLRFQAMSSEGLKDVPTGTGTAATCYSSTGQCTRDVDVLSEGGEWQGMLGYSVDITFARPMSVCSHSYVTAGFASEASDPVMWELSGKRDGEQEWSVLYETPSPLNTSGLGRNTAVPAHSICPINIVRKYTDTLKQTTNAPTMTAPVTVSPKTSSPLQNVGNSSTPSAGGDPPTMEKTPGANPVASPKEDEEDGMWLIVSLVIGTLLVMCGLLLLWYRTRQASAGKPPNALPQCYAEPGDNTYTIIEVVERSPEPLMTPTPLANTRDDSSIASSEGGYGGYRPPRRLNTMPAYVGSMRKPSMPAKDSPRNSPLRSPRQAFTRMGSIRPTHKTNIDSFVPLSSTHREVRQGTRQGSLYRLTF